MDLHVKVYGQWYKNTLLNLNEPISSIFLFLKICKITPFGSDIANVIRSNITTVTLFKEYFRLATSGVPYLCQYEIASHHNTILIQNVSE